MAQAELQALDLIEINKILIEINKGSIKINKDSWFRLSSRPWILLKSIRI